jgi:hypothetical protein
VFDYRVFGGALISSTRPGAASSLSARNANQQRTVVLVAASSEALMRTVQRCAIFLALGAAGCGSDLGAQDESGAALRFEDGGVPRGGPPDRSVPDSDVVLDCQPGPWGDVHVVFGCDEITVHTCKDLSNVVIELESGERVRFEGQSGHVNAFEPGDRIIGVWVKSGANLSGDGPGYGERFDAPEGSCDDPPEGGSGGDGEAGSGGNGGDPCEDFDPDTVCDEGDVPPGDDEPGDEGDDEPGDEGDDEPGDEGDDEPGDDENGGDPQYCAENPSEPGCMVD